MFLSVSKHMMQKLVLADSAVCMNDEELVHSRLQNLLRSHLG